MWLFGNSTQCPKVYEVSPLWLVKVNCSLPCVSFRNYLACLHLCFIFHYTYITIGFDSKESLQIFVQLSFPGLCLANFSMDPLNFEFSLLLCKNTIFFLGSPSLCYSLETCLQAGVIIRFTLFISLPSGFIVLGCLLSNDWKVFLIFYLVNYYEDNFCNNPS